MRKFGLHAFTVAAGIAATASVGCAETVEITLRGSELVMFVDGVAQPASRLVGATLMLALEDGRSAEVRIERGAVDPQVHEGDVFLYDLSVKGNDSTWTPVCEPEADGAPHAILQPVADGRIAVLCTAGALGKCIRFGYRPWATRDGQALDALWRSCVKMVRADYCGNDQPTTQDNMLIDYYDQVGIAARDDRPGLTFEAAWNEDGALCVAHTRVPQNMTLEQLAEACPRLRGRLGSACTEEAAHRFGSPLLMNASRGDGVPE